MMSITASIVLIFTLILARIVPDSLPRNERTSTVDLIESAGYGAETHSVTTGDGYILALHRIPNPSKKIVLYLHGYESSSADIVLKGKDQSLGFLLSDREYDVWMINFRGNRYSRNHTTLDATQILGEFWNFTWWEMGTEDLPAAITYILGVSNQTELQILGHGQGMTTYYVMLDQHPELASKISLATSMAPITYGAHTTGFLKLCSPFLISLPHWMTQSSFLPPSSLLDSLTGRFCAENSSTQPLCYDLLFSISGYDEEQQNKSDLTKQMQHFPAGTSARTIVHTAQNIQKGKFQAFDWGPAENLVRYGASSPPQVNLTSSTPAQALYLPPSNDFLVQPGDFNRLIQELPNLVKIFYVDWQKWNHMDSLSGIDAPRLLYTPLMEEMENY